MNVQLPKRAVRTYTQRLVAAPAAVFPLLCPVREADWIDGWEPLVVFSQSGVAEPDCVFLTRADPGEAIWYVTRHEPDEGVLEMIKVTPSVTACRLTVRLGPAGGGSQATITYAHTSLGPAGDAFVASFTDDYYQRVMRDWETRINHYLTHGTMLRRTDTS